jgi:hypothetical protein
MAFDYTSTGIVVGLVGLLLFLLRRAGRKKPKVTAGGAVLLRHGGGYTALGYVCIGIASFVAFCFAINFNKSWQLFLIMAGIMVMFLVPGLYLILTVARVWVTCDAHGTRSQGLTGRQREIAWQEVSRVTYHPKWMALTLHGPAGRVKVDRTMEGYEAFVDLMMRKVDSRLTAGVFDEQ